MRKLMFLVMLVLSLTSFAQKKKNQQESVAQNSKEVVVNLKDESWDFKPQTVEFIEYKSRRAMKILSNYEKVVLKDFDFTNGTIEFDIDPLDPMFTGFYFRMKDSKESECFYFRTGNAGNPQSIDAIQYAPIIDGVNLWDMLFHYQANANFKKDEWNHVKLVISGKQMRAYVNNILQPALEVPMLEGNTTSGTLAFDGQAAISNIVVKHNLVENLNPNVGIDPTSNDPRFVRKWMVSQPIQMEKNIDFYNSKKPNTETKWERIDAERRGLLNLTRKFGQTESRRLVWLKTNIHADKTQDKILRLGFSDEVWMYINNTPLYIDKNLYGTPMAKFPDGRCTIENSSILIPLKEGDNELLVGVANYFYGWGIVARFDNNDGLVLEK